MEKPTLQALVLADYVHTDRVTQKRTICGPFNVIASGQFGEGVVLPFKPWAYIVLTDLNGEYDFVLRYVDLKDNRLLMQSPTYRVRSADPLRNLDWAIEIPNLPLPHPGVYALDLYGNGQPIGSIRIPLILTSEVESHE